MHEAGREVALMELTEKKYYIPHTRVHEFACSLIQPDN